MPRHREFDPDKLLNTAILLFWEKGYFDTSVDELVKRSGVAKYGIYGVFGPKRDLFKSVLGQYARDRHRDIQSPIRKEQASLPDVLAFFSSLPPKLTTKGFQYGCLMVNTGIEIGTRDAELSEIVKAFFDETVETMKDCLDRAVSLGQLPASINTRTMAKYLVTEFRACLMLAASGHTKSDLKQHLNLSLKVLQP
ncbi:MAG: TetR/AcrR family transcriptional regulator [Candidatus Thiodiazotropha sp. (ex Monitilora ramsayi)]|nr:TetR/AcrR family transcriptional regulator [Candidatus Thiodiazotropha sp. (ex Monitilora ramsayi)]